MHILLLDQYYTPPQGKGRTRSHELARRWVVSGHSVTVLTSSSAFIEPSDAGGLDVDGVKVVVVPYHVDRRLGLFRQSISSALLWGTMLWKAARISDVDAVFMTSDSASIALAVVGFATSRVKAAPLVSEIGGLSGSWETSPWASRVWRSTLAKLSIRAADYVIAQSPDLEGVFLRLGCAEQKISVISDGCDSDLFRVSADHGDALLKAYPHLAQAPLVILEGPLESAEPPAVLIKIANAMLTSVPNIRFLICGDGPVKADVRVTAAHVGVLEKNLWMLPALPRTQMPQLYAAATVVVSLKTSSKEGHMATPGTVFDALAAGKPIALDHSGWHASLIQSRGAGIILDTQDPDLAARDLLDFVQDREALRRFGEQASALADSKFSREKLVGELRSVLEAAHRAMPAAERRRKRSLAVKRGVDLIVSLLALILLSPILLVLCAAVFLKMGRPIFFRQRRPGLHGKPFKLLKFRTMTNETDGAGNPLPDGQRLTSLGRFLRRTSLDELPELIDVLLGDMSLVGPRPLLMEYLPYYTAAQARRHSVPPGITGWAQVNGRNALTWEEKFELDTWYVDNRTLWLDFKILLRTAWVVISRKGISHPGEESMPRFDEIMARRQGAEDV